MHSVKSLGLLRGTQVVKQDMSLVIWIETAWSELCKEGDRNPYFLISSPLFAVRIHFLMGTLSSECRAVTDAMLTCYHGDRSGNKQTCHSPDTQVPHSDSQKDYSTPNVPQFKVHLC